MDANVTEAVARAIAALFCYRRRFPIEATRESAPRVEAKKEVPPFELNETVMVYCGSRKQWLTSVVVELAPHGSLHVDCGVFRKLIPRSQCTADTIQKAKKEVPPFELNETVMVYCGSRKQWLTSVVVELAPHGSLHVDCGAFRKLIPRSQCTADTIQKVFCEQVGMTVSEAEIGFWEYDNDGIWEPYTREECKQLDIERQKRVDFIMKKGPDRVPHVVRFTSERSGEESDPRTDMTRDIRRELSAKELVEAARKQMRICKQQPVDVEPPRYTDPDSIFELLSRKTEPVKLIKGSWLMRYTNTQGQSKGLPPRQDIPTQGFLPPTEVQTPADGNSNIFSISYCWRAPHHPDEDGLLLRDIASRLQEQMKDSHWMREDSEDSGIFWDFGSLFQKTDNGTRTKQGVPILDRTQLETDVFSEALDTMDIWYAHVIIMTFIVNGQLAQILGLDYETRGWTHFERSCAELIKPVRAGGAMHTRPMITEFAESGRKLPLSPELFAAQLARRRFTVKEDKEIVVGLYTGACMQALRQTLNMSLHGIKLDGHDSKQVASVVQHCSSLERLRLSEMDMNDHDVQAIMTALQSCTSLQTFDLQGNQIGDSGAIAIAKMLPRMTSLSYLGIQKNNLTEVGKDALRKAWRDAGNAEQTLVLAEIE